MSDAKYFTTTKKGEMFELKTELNSEKKEKRREAVKKVIASMTVGKDVRVFWLLNLHSALFPDVINCMQTDNLELKKLVYLYLMNYAKTQPDMAIMAVNTFVKDCDDPNPLIRALAVRTMGCIRVEKITEYLCEPLRKCLKDEDPYVRKTAAVCVAKLFDINPHLVEEQGFLDALKELLSDSNPMVVANAVAALAEINESSTTPLIDLNTGTVNKLLSALNECTEWGQVFILDFVANYTPLDEKEAQSIAERVSPRLAHANAAVVLSAVKVLMRMLELMPEESDAATNITRKLAPPLVTLLSAEPEIQYVALRNINLIVQKKPDVLKQEYKVFFVKYNDPIYVKLEKLDIMIRLASQANIAQVLSELKEYATEVDVDFVRKSVRAIGRCAIKVENSAERCVSTLLDLIQTKVNYVVQEAIVVIKDIFRKYPNKYESIISTLCENLDTLDEPEARASMIWIIGEYAERIDNADELLESFLDGFHDESTQVQLQLLTAIIKLFLKRPAETQELVQRVLTVCTQESDNPDLRDRAFIYWRLLSNDPNAAKQVVLADKPLISEETDRLEPTLLDELCCHIGSLASVYHKPPSAFLESKGALARKAFGGAGGARLGGNALNGAANGHANGRAGDAGAGKQPTVIKGQQDNEDILLGDLLTLDLSTPSQGMPGVGGMNDMLGVGMSGGNPNSAANDLLGGDLDGLLGGGPVGDHGFGMGSGMSAGMGVPGMFQQQASTNSTVAPNNATAGGGGNTAAILGDIFGSFGGMSLGSNSQVYVPPKQTWLAAAQGKGLEISGHFVRRGGQISMEMTLTNKAMSAMSDFAIQFNKNSFGLQPASPLQVHSPLLPTNSVNASLTCSTNGPVLKMTPLNNLQVAVKNNIDVFYFQCIVSPLAYFDDDGTLDKSTFLTTWQDIASDNERSYPVTSNKFNADADAIATQLHANNIFRVSTNQVDGNVALYHSIKLTNNIWILVEFKCSPVGGTHQLSLKCRAPDACSLVADAIKAVLNN